jgi:methionyl-tRNA formyltransferase
MRIAFMGTPWFAAVSLQHLLRAGKEVCLAVSQPDRERGRGRRIEQTPVKKIALEHGVRMEQPITPNSPEFLRILKDVAPDMIVVVSYGHILKPAVLSVPRRGCVNLHPSLLPKYRGAAPIQWAIINGESETGITTLFMNEQMDAGDIIEQITVAIGDEQTTGDIREKVASRGAELLLSTVELVEAGKARRFPQNDAEATYAPKIDPKMCRIDWSIDSKQISQLIRGLSPYPGAHSYFRAKRIKFLRAVHVQEPSSGRELGEISSSDGRLLVSAKNGFVWVKEMQLEGKKPIRDSDFINGYAPRTHERIQ